MKTNLRKLFALFLTLAMVLPMAVPALPVSAEETAVVPIAEITGPVADAADIWDFASDAQAADFDFYQSGSSGFTVQNGMLVPSGNIGEMKAIAKASTQNMKFISVDIIPGSTGLINAGLYIGASDMGNNADQIDALAFIVESWFTGWSDAPNRIDMVIGEFPTWKEHKRLITETGNGNNLFTKGVKEPVNLRVDLQEDMVTVTLSLVSNSSKYVQMVYECDPADLVGNVGIRANNSDVRFDNFKIGYDRPVPEKLQQGIEFTEAGAKVQLNSATGTVPQTVEAWVKVDPDSTASRTGIVSSFTGPYTANAKKGDWALFTNESGILWWYEKNANGQYSTAKGPSIKTGEWTHVAITREEGIIRYYINGSEVAFVESDKIALGEVSAKAPTLGYCEYGGENYNYLDGTLGDVSLWSTARTADQIQEDMFTEVVGNEEGLMHHWGLDEQAGTVIRDSAASGNDGSISKQTGLSWTEGSALNQGLEFSVAGAKAQVNQATEMIPQTVEAWVKVDANSTASRTAIVGAFKGPYTADAQKGDWALFTNGSGGLWWYEKNAKGQYSTAKGPTIKTGEWTHVAITRTEGTVKYYINGQEVATATGNIVLNTVSTKAPTLGYCEYGGENYNYLDGALGDVRLWSTTRTADQIREDMFTEAAGNEDGLMHHWGLDEQAGTVFWDSADAGNHGTIAGQTGLDWTEGSALNEGLEFSEVGAKATLSKATGTVPQTVEAWIRLDKESAASRTGIISAFTGPYTADAQKGDWALFTGTSGSLWWYEKNANGQYSTAKGPTIKTGEWTHVAITREAGLIRYYINGSEVAFVESDKIVLGSVSNKVPTLGYCEYGGENYNYLDGALGDVRVWSTTRTVEEIRTTMYADLTGTENGLMSCWKLDEQIGSAVKDATATANDGTIGAGISWIPGTSSGVTEMPEQNYDNAGFNFSQVKTWITSKEVDVSSDHTIEAWVKIPEAIKTANVIVQNDKRLRYEFTITTAGYPRLYWRDENDVETEIIVTNTKVNTGKWTHIAFTSDSTAKTITCYVNGIAVYVKKDTVLGDITTRKLYVGNTFLGYMADLRIWDKAMTAKEIQASMSTAYTQAVTGLLFNAPLDEVNPTSFRDLSGNDNTIQVYKRLLEWHTDNTQPKDYSIVVIPDQQVLSGHYTEDLDDIYRWIAENAEEENIQFVINLGDITDYNSEPEWLLSLDALDIIKGTVPYAFVPGNHEYVIPGSYKYDGYGYRNLTEMNKYFGNIYDDQAEFGGTYDGGVENSWHEFEAFGNQYLVFAFEYAPRDSVLAWASKIIEAHPYHQVILATHSYLDNDATRMGNINHGSGYGFLYEEGKEDPNSAREMWDEFVSQHENIIMVLCGHIGTDDVVYRTDKGVHGNDVLQMLIDGQDLDHYYRGGGFLTLMRFDADGENMELTYFSPYHGENGEDEYLNDNILSFTFPAQKQPPVAQVGEQTYETVTEAIANANGQVVTILADTDEAITISEDVVIDLAGFSLSKVTVTEGVKLNLIDSTADYAGTKGSATVTGSVESLVEYDGKKYMVIGEEGVYAPHRYYVGITSVNIAPAVTGFGYKAQFYGDSAVQAQIANIGYDLWLTDSRVVTRTTAFKNILTLRLKNFDVVNYGEAPVNAKVFITLTDGSRIESAVHSYAMRSMVEQVNETHTDFDKAQLKAVANMIYDTAMEGWNVSNILNALIPEASVEAVEVVSQDMTVGGETVNLTLKGAYTFTAQETQAIAAYADWIADYYVTMDNAASDGLYLAGNYGEYGWIAIPVQAGVTYTDVPVVSTLLGKTLTYADVISTVGTFTCGVADANGSNAGSTVTVQLRLINPETGAQIIISTANISL